MECSKCHQPKPALFVCEGQVKTLLCPECWEAMLAQTREAIAAHEKELKRRKRK